MINRELLDPKSIAVIGGSNNIHKPGGAIVRNIIQGGYQGTLRIVNPKEDEVQGIKVFHDARELPPTELAVLVIPAKFCPDTVELLAREKQTKTWYDQRDRIYNDKIREIEEAHDKWQKEQKKEKLNRLKGISQ